SALLKSVEPASIRRTVGPAFVAPAAGDVPAATAPTETSATAAEKTRPNLARATFIDPPHALVVGTSAGRWGRARSRDFHIKICCGQALIDVPGTSLRSCGQITSRSNWLKLRCYRRIRGG